MSIKVLFGSETGTAEMCAEKLTDALIGRGILAEVVDMEGFGVADLYLEPTVIVITSTFGDGEPPLNAEALLEGLRSERPDLSELRYAVLALGDSNYASFAQCGRDFDAILGELGATALIERIDVDGDPYDPLLEFQRQLLAALEHIPGVPRGTPPPKQSPSLIGRLKRLL